MNLESLKENFKPTTKKIIISLVVAIVVDIIYWLIVENTKMVDVVELALEWYKYNILINIFSASGIVVLLVIAVWMYVVLSLRKRK